MPLYLNTPSADNLVENFTHYHNVASPRYGGAIENLPGSHDACGRIESSEIKIEVGGRTELDF